MKVKDLIAELQKMDPEAYCTTWKDVHESSAPSLIRGVYPEFVKLEEPTGYIASYSDEMKAGYVAAVRVQ